MILSKLKKRGDRNRAQQRTSERGFSLVETSVAMVILMVAGLGVASLFTYSIRYNSGGNDRALAISIAQQQIEQLRSVSFTDAVLNVQTATVLTPIVSNGRTYRVTKTVTGSNNNAAGTPTLKTITIRVDPMSPGWAGFPVILRTVRSASSSGTN